VPGPTHESNDSAHLEGKVANCWEDLHNVNMCLALPYIHHTVSKRDTTFLLMTFSSGCCLPNTSTFAPNELAQCLYCVLLIIRWAFGAHLDVGLAQRQNPCRFIGTDHVCFPHYREDGRLWRKRTATYEPCEALSLLTSRRSCPTRRSCLNCMPMERMAR